MSSHAKLSPSKSASWLNCTASVRLQEAFPEVKWKSPTSSVYAEEGTHAHAMAESLLKYGTGMIDPVLQYVNYIRDIEKQETTETYIPELLVEVPLDLSGFIPESFGTSDAVVLGETTWHIIDLKYGKGVPVKAKNNTQGLIYALGVLDKFRDTYPMPSRIVVHIVQPRVKDGISTWELTYKECMEHRKVIKDKAEGVFNNPIRFAYDAKGCRFCEAKSICPQYINKSEWAKDDLDF